MTIERIETIPCGCSIGRNKYGRQLLHVFEEPPSDGLSNRKKEKPGELAGWCLNESRRSLIAG